MLTAKATAKLARLVTFAGRRAIPPALYDFAEHNYSTTAKQIETRLPGPPTWGKKKHRKIFVKSSSSNDAVKKNS
jgi:hypothetical protein